MSMFDTYLMVDWSSRKKPSPQKDSRDAIWWAALHSQQGTEPVVRYERTRSDAIGAIRQFLIRAAKAGHRVLAGFDFAFGYPQGLVDILRSGIADFPRSDPDASPALAMWQWLYERIEDDWKNRKNDNNRFDVAAEINKAISGRADLGPFWGRYKPKEEKISPEDKVSTGKPVFDFSGRPFGEKRLSDLRAETAKTVWQLHYTGSVGSQSLVGIPRLECLRRDKDLGQHITVWPLDIQCLQETRPSIVIAEIYPSLITKGIGDTIPDRAQVLENASAFKYLDTQGRLRDLFDLDAILKRLHQEGHRDAVAGEEGWILGTGCEDTLRSVAKEDSTLRHKRKVDGKTKRA